MADRWLTLETPLGNDVLIPTGVVGYEAVSKPFRFEVIAVAKTDAGVTPASLLNKSVTLGMAKPGDAQRLVNGVVTSLAAGPKTRTDYGQYQLSIAPKLWTLDLRAQYRIFQKKTIKDIVSAILSDHSITDFSFSLNTAVQSQQRDYCIQYGETDLAFVQRLLAENGCFYYFTHADGQHKIIFCDDASTYADADEASVRFSPGNPQGGNCVYSFEMNTSLVPTKWSVNDFNFKTPNQSPQKSSPLGGPYNSHSPGPWEPVVYGVTAPDDTGLGGGTVKALADARATASEAEYEVAKGASNCASFTPGYKFELQADETKKYVVTEIHHEASDPYMVGDSTPPSYQNSFSCIPDSRVALSQLPSRKPFVPGPHTAMVVGASGDEILTDEHGRIKVQFHWDTINPSDDTCSCFIRVAQLWAGKGWGSMFIPRVGMEVVVHFLEGDPDRPLVTGAVYNASNTAPWTLPDNKEKSGIITRSTPNGTSDNANWLLFVDKKDSEKIDVQAEKDFLRTVKNDDTLDVKHDQTRTIKNNRTTTIKEGNESFTVEKGNRDITIKAGNDTLKINQGGRSVTLDQGDLTLKLTGGNQSTTLSQGNQTTTLSTGNLTASLSAGDIKMSCDAGKITLTATSGITLTCGPSKIELTASGINIEGVTFTAKGSAKAAIQGAMVSVAGDGITEIKGGIVKIN